MEKQDTVKSVMNRKGFMDNESVDEDELIVRSITDNIQKLIDSQEVQQQAIIRLQESLQALRDYHSRDTMEHVIEGVYGNAPF